MKTETFKKQYLMEELDLPYEAIEDTTIGNSRWSVVHQIIFQHPDGRYFKTTYQRGATEQQDENPWEYEEDVKCIQVEKKLVQVEKWVPIGE